MAIGSLHCCSTGRFTIPTEKESIGLSILLLRCEPNTLLNILIYLPGCPHYKARIQKVNRNHGKFEDGVERQTVRVWSEHLAMLSV